ncbi:hypothetical protein [Croceiramulus getboli]|nr:hypothetical protein P8624_12035 [Flavobacteriaceae bacterium YJPT1-3]
MEKNKKYNSDITEQDKALLGAQKPGVRKDGGDDRQLLDREREVDFAGEDLDVPGRENAQKGNGPRGLNDEENKVHSQGGESKNNLERDDSAL